MELCVIKHWSKGHQFARLCKNTYFEAHYGRFATLHEKAYTRKQKLVVKRTLSAPGTTHLAKVTITFHDAARLHYPETVFFIVIPQTYAQDATNTTLVHDA